MSTTALHLKFPPHLAHSSVSITKITLMHFDSLIPLNDPFFHLLRLHALYDLPALNLSARIPQVLPLHPINPPPYVAPIPLQEYTLGHLPCLLSQ
ncbi:hypothetical protein PCASD_24082 [Puccinia coronata f. sp. avenae]|uniref:Uncharacterized protein n=1 Tax=Puccinia coronata f. sp. avenae TaxID=200324 RepID=A0A2N5SEB2_9BASI|nr:hypothetical protein PCASD_24082 [Puccinia coronata f. sp. avenae]